MTNDNSASIVAKVWNYAHVLKNAGVGYGDYIEVRAARALITYLLFLKLADEMTELGFDPPSPRLRRAGNPIPDAFAWAVLSGKVAEASRLRSWIQDQRRDASATIVENLGKAPRLGAHDPCLCG